MNPKSFIWIGASVGGVVGGYIPALWGDSLLSFTSIILSTVGGLVGIWLGFKLSKMI